MGKRCVNSISIYTQYQENEFPYLNQTAIEILLGLTSTYLNFKLIELSNSLKFVYDPEETD